MKQGIRVLGIDDAAFDYSDRETFLTGVVYRGTEFIEDIETVPVEVDGEDSTEKVIRLFNKCNNPRQIKAILLDGISFAGFNIVDLEQVQEETGKPVIAVTANRPDRDDFRDAMERSDNYDERFEKLEKYTEVSLKDGTAFIQFRGCDENRAIRIVEGSTIHGLTPEPIRVAHMIGRAFLDQE